MPQGGPGASCAGGFRMRRSMVFVAPDTAHQARVPSRWPDSAPRLAQAGNKSALSYRADRGIPGYTGYIPSTQTVPLDPKGGCEHTGRLVGEADKAAALLEGVAEGAASE